MDFLGIAKFGDGKGSYPANARSYLVLPILSLFVFLALWFFRTHDTRQRIEQTNRQLQQTGQQAKRQLQQANFAKGLDNLVSDNPLQVDVGVILLLEVSKATPAFDKEIRLAFIKRLKDAPPKIEEIEKQAKIVNRLSYAQYILRWLIDHPKENDRSINLDGMDCRCQEFTSVQISGDESVKLKMSEILPKVSNALIQAPDTSSDGGVRLPVYRFQRTNCENISFENIDLGNFNFSGAKVNMVGGYINIHRPPFGVDTETLQECIDPKTGKVIGNPHIRSSHF